MDYAQHSVVISLQVRLTPPRFLVNRAPTGDVCGRGKKGWRRGRSEQCGLEEIVMRGEVIVVRDGATFVWHVAAGAHFILT